MAVPSSSQLSQLGATTAISFEDYRAPSVKVSVSIDDVDLESAGSSKDNEVFIYDNLRFLVKEDTFVSFTHPSRTRLTMKVVSIERSEWQLLLQMRIRTGANETLKVVDKAVVEFTPGGRPVSVDVTHDAVRQVKFELRTINKLYLAHPKFDSGDIAIKFSDGVTLRTWKSLLSAASRYMTDRLSDPEVDCLEVEDFDSGTFKELLLQLYPTRRPLDANFCSLTKAALSFQVDELIYQLSNYLVQFNQYPMPIEEKWKTAMDMELHLALEELVVQSVRTGHWDRLLKEGFHPESFFSTPIYRSIVCPAVLAARGMGLLDSRLKPAWTRPHYFSDQNSNTTVLVFRGTRFHVNKGLLAIHGTDGFTVGKMGNLMARFSPELQSCCAAAEIVPGKVLISLLDSMQLGGPPVDPRLLRPAIIFCHDHNWNLAKEQLEQRLLLEPATSRQHYMQQIRFAERFGLNNMLRNCIFRAESSCHDYAARLANDGFPGVSESTKYKIIDRLCSGWALMPKYVNNLGIRVATSFRQREVQLEKGGALGFEQHINEGTLVGLDSDYAFGPIADLKVD